MNPKTQPATTSTRQARKAYWSNHADTWQESGLTQGQYCQENRLKTFCQYPGMNPSEYRG